MIKMIKICGELPNSYLNVSYRYESKKKSLYSGWAARSFPE